MKYALLLAGFGLFLGFFGCKKVDITTDGEVVFFMKNDTPGDSTANFEAGKNGYYMWTNWGNYDSVSTARLTYFDGMFQEINNADVPYLLIRFRNSEENTGEPLVLRIGEVPFTKGIFTPDFLGLDIRLSAVSGGEFPYLIKWTVDGDTSTGSLLKFDTQDSVFSKDVQLEMTDAQNRKASVMSHIQFNGETFTGCNLDIDYDGSSQIYAAGNPWPSNIYWQSDSLFFQGIKIPIGSVPQKWNVLAEFQSAGCVSIANFETSPGSQFPVCNARIFPSAQSRYSLPDLADLEPGTVEIFYLRPGTGLFFSKWAKQPASSFFEITSIEEYDRNEKGQKTKKLGVRFSADLKSADGDIISLKNRSGVIGVAYPD